MFKFKLDPLEGTTQGHITIVARASDSRKGLTRFFVRCVCGTEMIKSKPRLVGAKGIRSCGCQGTGRIARKWTPEDYEFLDREFPLRGPEIADEMERTKHAVRFMAGKRGLKFAYVRHYNREWTPEEEAILRRHYPNSALKCLELLPTRSKHQISHRAHKMGIRLKRGRRLNQWSRAEIKILKENYQSGGWEAVQALLPHRTRDAIFARAGESGISALPKWTAEEEADVLRLFREGGVIACRERFPDRTDASIRGKARKLGALVKPAWTEEEIEVVRQTFPMHGARKCMELLPSKTLAMIANICKKHDIRSLAWWTPEDEQVLRDSYGRLGATKLKARFPQHTEAAIRHKAKTLGLSSDRIWTEEEVAVVRRLYVRYGSAGCAKHLPRHTAEAIRNKAQQLGKKTKKNSRYRATSSAPGEAAL